MEEFIEILREVYKVIFHGPLNDMLVQVSNWWAGIIGDLILEIIADLLYDLTVQVLKFIDAVESFQRGLMGLDNIVMTPNGNVDIISSLFSYSEVNKIVVSFVLISFLLTTIFIVRRIMTEITRDESEKKPFSLLIRRVILCWGRLFSIFLFCACLLNFSRVGALTVASATGFSSANLSNVVFIMGAQNQIKDVRHREEIISKYLESADTQHVYWRGTQIDRDFVKRKINYILILISAAIMLVILIKVIIKLARRLLTLIILYIVGPFFAAMAVLDGKEKAYDDWKDMFVANFIQIILVLVAYYVFSIIAVEFTATPIFRFTDNNLCNSIISTVFLLCLAQGIPNSFKYGYNLITDKGRFLGEDIPSLKDIISLTH